MARRWAVVVAAVLIGAGCSSPGPAGEAVSASGPSTSASTAPSALEMKSEDVAAALRAVTGADPVLVPADVPAGWTATVAVEPAGFVATYTGLDGERFMLSISVPNPPPPEDSGSQHLGFRGDPRGLYQQQTDDPTTERFLVWNEPGSWTGQAGYPGSAHPADVPYFVSATGMSEAAFMRLVDSLSPVPHDPRPEAASIVVSPNQQLHDGQQVQVTLSHFGPNDRVRLSECFDGGSVTPLGCGEQLARQPFVDTDATGGGSTSFVVRRTTSAKPLNTDETFECTDRCVIVATTNLPGTTPALAKLSFE